MRRICKFDGGMAAMISRVAVVGAGSWGTVFAHLCAHNAATVLYARDGELAEAMHATRENSRYLPGRTLHPELRVTSDMGEATRDACAVVMAVPSHGFRGTLRLLAPHVGEQTPVISLAKGLESATGKRMTEVVGEELPGRPTGVLSGPSLAKEIFSGHAAAAVLAMAPGQLPLAAQLQSVFCARGFRVYTSTDEIGVEIAGAAKNVIALATGIADGMGAGDNTRATLITRGLAEATRLGVALGGDPATFAGLAGVGDIVATCVSPQSRNRHAGERLGRGESIEDIAASMDQVAEGIGSAPVLAALARSLSVDMPITEEVRAVVEDGRSAAAAYRSLLDRPPTSEIRG